MTFWSIVIMASYQCSGPQYRITIWRPYDILEHCVMASYQCSGPQYQITIWRPYDILEHCVMASYQCSGSIQNNKLEALRHFGALCNGIISMLGTSIPNNKLRHYDFLEHCVMASYQCSGPEH
jgi:hypothetical protein